MRTLRCVILLLAIVPSPLPAAERAPDGSFEAIPFPQLADDPEEPIIFPADAGVIDVTRPPYNAKGDGKTDDTDAIQKALDDFPSQNRIVYLPNGIYLVSHQIEFGLSRRFHPGKPIDGRDPLDQRLTILQGESRNGTIIQLQDHCREFQSTGIQKGEEDIGRPVARGVVWTGENVAQHFRNAVRNLTVNTGRGNPGAAGIQFNASNQGCLHAVKLVCGDDQGPIGCDIGFTGDAGPAVIRHLEVVGFDYGIWAAALNSFTIWDANLSGQKKAGICAPYELVALHRIRSNNACPALSVGKRWSTFCTLVDGDLIGGSPNAAAIVINGKTADIHFFARNVHIGGYGLSVRSTKAESRDAKGDIDEYSYNNVTRAFADSSTRTLNLPVKNAPDVPWDNPKRDWVNVASFGAKGDENGDDTAAVQSAIDSGAKVVYFPGGTHRDRGGNHGVVYNCKNLVLRANVQRLIACEAYVNADRLDVQEGPAPAVIIERLMPSWTRGRMNIHQLSSRPLIVRDINATIYQESAGDVFIDDVCGGLHMQTPGASGWARYLNFEVDPGPSIVNNGGNLWIMGSKTEHPTPQIELLNGSRTEIFGSMWYASFGKAVEKPGIKIVDSAVTLVALRQHSFGKGSWTNWITAEQHGEQFIWKNRALDFLSTSNMPGERINEHTK